MRIVKALEIARHAMFATGKIKFADGVFNKVVPTDPEYEQFAEAYNRICTHSFEVGKRDD